MRQLRFDSNGSLDRDNAQQLMDTLERQTMHRTRKSDRTETSRQRLSVAYEVFNRGQESNIPLQSSPTEFWQNKDIHTVKVHTVD